MSSGKDLSTEPIPATAPKVVCGGVSNKRPVDEEDLEIWNMYKEHSEKQIREQFQIPQSHTLKPVQVATQVVAGQNYFFRVELSEKKYATARIYHVPWKQETHGKRNQVEIHPKLTDNLDEDLGHL